MKRLSLILTLCGLVSIPAPLAIADTTGEFLQGLEGEYRGRGMASVGPSGKMRRITCQISNAYSADDSALKVEGDCASTQGKGKVVGRLTHQGGKLSGAFLAPRDGVNLTKSYGTLEADKMVVSVSLFDEKASQLTRTRQIIEKTDEGFKSTFLRFDNGSGQYEDAGEVVFTRR